MKIAFVNNTYRCGGAETVARDLFEGCYKAGHESRFYVAIDKTYPDHPRIVPMYPRLLSRLHYSRVAPLLHRYAPRASWTDRSFRELGHGWPDVIHLHNYHAEYATIETLAAVARLKPFVWTLHGHWAVTGGCDHPSDCTGYLHECGNCPQLGLWPVPTTDNTAEQLRLKRSQLGSITLDVITPSRYVANRIAKSPVGRRWRIHHIPNGIRASEFAGGRKQTPSFRRALGAAAEATTILIVNRNFREPQKGFDIAQHALNDLAASSPVQVILAGAESEWAASQLSPTLNATAVGYLTSREQLAAWYEAADVFLFASPAENFPCVILEAMASECCVVATPTGGVVEQLSDGETGILASAIDGAALGRVLQMAVTDPDLRRRLGRAARLKASTDFSLDTTIANHVRLYESLTADRSHATLAPGSAHDGIATTA